MGQAGAASRSFESITATASTFPSARRNHAGVFTENEIYIFGGQSLTRTTSMQDSWRFNPQTHTWTRLPDLQAPLVGARAAVFTTTLRLTAGQTDLAGAVPQILISGGFTTAGDANPTSYIFDGSLSEPVAVDYGILLPLVRQ